MKIKSLFVPGFLLALAATLLLAACGGADQPATEESKQLLPLQQASGAEPASSPLDSPLPAPAPSQSSRAANADVEFVSAQLNPSGSWTFRVTVRHPDTGWEDYADGWDVVLPDGTVALPDPGSKFTRLLLHPHENEQPFTRSQGGIIIPDGVTQVTVRAHDLVDGWGGRVVVVDLTQASGPDFEVIR